MDYTTVTKHSSSKRKRLSCLFTAVEADPLVKVGGLGDVAFALPYALRNLHPEAIENHEIDIRLALPCHSTACIGIDSLASRIQFEVPTSLGSIPTTAYKTEINDLPVYLISSPLIPKETGVYTSDEYNDGLKFIFFSQATLALAKALNWQPDIIHVNDWHTAITTHLLHLQQKAGQFPVKTRAILTIHNLPFMGAGTEEAIKDLGIPFSTDKNLPSWAKKFPLPIGLTSSQKIVAVSPTYAREILTPEFGCGLENYLATRQDALCGIINGIDTKTWDPATDRQLFVRFSLNNLFERQNNKHVLQNEMGFSSDPEIPLLSYIGRMDQQKGIDLVIEGLRLCKDRQWQIIILGTGNQELEKKAVQLETEFPDQVRAMIKYDSKLARRIYGGADLLLMPSRYEPCGLAQMIAMRYGCLPLARATGGLKDTITDSSGNGKATGFLFEKETIADFTAALRIALQEYKNKARWYLMQTTAMRTDFSWHKSALSYAELYRKS